MALYSSSVAKLPVGANASSASLITPAMKALAEAPAKTVDARLLEYLTFEVSA